MIKTIILFLTDILSHKFHTKHFNPINLTEVCILNIRTLYTHLCTTFVIILCITNFSDSLILKSWNCHHHEAKTHQTVTAFKFTFKNYWKLYKTYYLYFTLCSVCDDGSHNSVIQKRTVLREQNRRTEYWTELECKNAW